MLESFLSKEEDTRLEFLLRLHENGKVSLASDDPIEAVAQHIHWILFPNDLMSYIKTQRVVNFPGELIERLQKAGIWLKFSISISPVVDPAIEVVYSDGDGTAVTYRVPLAFKYQ